MVLRWHLRAGKEPCRAAVSALLREEAEEGM